MKVKRKEVERAIAASVEPPVLKGDKKRPPKPYPHVTLEGAIVVAQQIKAKNGGNPWTPDGVASAIGHSAKTNEFYYLTAASRDFGLHLPPYIRHESRKDIMGRYEKTLPHRC